MKNIMMNVWTTKSILDNRKTQTRRAVKKFYDISLKEPKKYPLSFADMPKDLEFIELQGYEVLYPVFYSKSADKFYCGENIKYKIGEKIWVREPAKVSSVGFDCFDFTAIYLADETSVKIDTPKRLVEYFYFKESNLLNVVKSPAWLNEGKGIPNGCIKEMARIFLKITNIKVERLHSCYSYEDLQAEGLKIEDENGLSKFQEEVQDEWIELWNKTAPKGYKWDDNPYVFVYEFERVNRDGSEL